MIILTTLFQWESVAGWQGEDPDCHEEASMTSQREVAQEQVVSVSQGADVYVESLNANDVKYIFINSGTDTFPIQESLARYMSQGRSVPEVILCLDEEVAMSAAHGYYMMTGKPQVLLVHVDAGTMQVGGALHNAQRGRAGMVFALEGLHTPSTATCPAARV